MNRTHAHETRTRVRLHRNKIIYCLMNNLQKKCDNCKYAYNSIHSTLVQCKMKERLIKNSKTGQISIDFKHDSCYWWKERPTTYKKINWNLNEQQLTLF